MDTTRAPCPRCAEDIEADARVCGYCGQEFAVGHLGYCTSCHDRVEVGDGTACPDCGSEVLDVTVERDPLVAPAAAPPQPPPPAPPLPPPMPPPAPVPTLVVGSSPPPSAPPPMRFPGYPPPSPVDTGSSRRRGRGPAVVALVVVAVLLVGGGVVWLRSKAGSPVDVSITECTWSARSPAPSLAVPMMGDDVTVKGAIANTTTKPIVGTIRIFVESTEPIVPFVGPDNGPYLIARIDGLAPRQETTWTATGSTAVLQPKGCRVASVTLEDPEGNITRYR